MAHKLKITGHYPELSPADSEEQYLLHNAAVEWSLAQPIVIQDPSKDVKSRLNWQGRVEPFHHQMQNLMTFCRRLPVTLIADDVGLGKTISAGLILSELMIRGRVSRALVICPSILGEQWKDELLAKFNIGAEWATGGSNLRAAMQGDAEVVATTYQTARGSLERIKPGMFDMLILDEAHKVRNLHGTQSPPLFAERIRKVLEKRLFKYVLLLTATPIQNRLWDLYSLVDCLSVAKGHENPFGTPSQFKTNYIADSPNVARRIYPNAENRFHSILRQYLVRTRREDVQLLFPKRQVKLFKVKPEPVDLALQKIVKSAISGLNGLEQSSLLQALMSSPHALERQAGNSSNPALAAKFSEHRASYEKCAKLKGLLKLIKEVRKKRPDDWRLVIFTGRKATQAAICCALDERGIAYGTIQGGKAAANYRAVSQYSCNPPIANVIVSTDAGAEGLNLQSGNILVNYDLPWNPMVVEQRIGRVQRLASAFKEVVIINLVLADSPEAKVVERLVAKLQVIAQSIGDVEAVLRQEDGSDDKQVESFEASIRGLVLRSLKGQDINRDAELRLQSVQQAKELFESERKDMDKQLGQLDELHHTGPSMPALSQPEPTIAYDALVKRAFAERGYRVEELSQNAVEFVNGRNRVVAAFTTEEARSRRTAPGYRQVHLYCPEKPDFERLVQKWHNRSQHLVRNAAALTLELAEQLAQTWLERIADAEFESVAISEEAAAFQGIGRVKVTATTGVDSYEKLVDIPLSPETHAKISQSQELPISRELLSVLRAAPGAEDAVESTCDSDQDIRAFCDFYDDRLTEEHQRNQKNGGHRSNKRIEEDFRPSVESRLVSAAGTIYESCVLHVGFRLQGSTGYSVTLRGVPVSGEVLEEPTDWAKCDKTTTSVPLGCLSTCDISGKRVLTHLLIASDESGRRALQEHTIHCGETGRIALEDEFAASSFSGKRAIASIFVRSAISGRLGLPDESVTCDLTGDVVLLDEALTSEVSGRRFRSDQSADCLVSGMTGHTSEFVACAASRLPVLRDHAIASDLSGEQIAASCVMQSDKSSRLGGAHEIVICEYSNHLLLRDEVAECQITGAIVEQSLLAASDQSDKLVLANLLFQCAETGTLGLADEFTMSDFSERRAVLNAFQLSGLSGRRGLADEFTTCEFTDTKILNDEFTISQASGKRLRSDESVTCTASAKVAHKSEFVLCAVTGKSVLPDEAVLSEVSDAYVLPSEKVTSERSGRIGGSHELVICASSEKRLLSDESGLCEVSGRTVDLELLRESDESGRLACTDLLEECGVTGKLALPKEFSQSAFSGARAVRSAFETSAISNRIGLPEELSECEFTKAKALRDELLTSEVSGKLCRIDESETSALSKKPAHKSELIRCCATGDWMLPDEAVITDTGGERLRPDQSVTSVRTGRVGRIDESTTCQFSNALLLTDEVSKCDVSGRTIDRTLLQESSESGIRACVDLLEQCSVTQAYALAEEFRSSDVSQTRAVASAFEASGVSGRLGLPSEIAVCEFTDTRGLIDEVGKSEVSQRTFRLDQEGTSDLSNVTGHESEFKKFDGLAGRYLPDEVSASDVSGKPVRSDRKVVSERSARVGTPGERAFCAVSNKVLLTDEVSVCAVSGITADLELMDRCETTGNMAIRKLMVVCEVSKKRHLSSETVTTRDGLTIAKTEGVWATSLEQWVLKSDCLPCGFSGELVPAPDIVTSALSGKDTHRRNTRISISGRIGHKSEFVQCEYSGRNLLQDEAGKSDYSGQTTALQDLQLSDTGRAGIHAEFTSCSHSGRTLLLDEVAMSVVTGKPFAKELLTPSGRSGKLAHKSEFVVCALTGVNLLPTEVGTSSVSGKVVDLAKLATSEVSGNIAIRESEMSQCAATNTWAIQSELAECEVSNKRVLPSVLRDCAVTQMTASSSFMVKSEFSQSWMLKDQAKRSSLSGKTMLPSEACRCVWSDEVIANAESRICERTGLPAKPGFVTRGGVLIDFERLMARRKGKRLSDGMKSGEFAQWLRTCADERVPEFQNAWFLVSPTKRYILLCLEVWKYLGIKTSYYGLVVQNRTKKSPFKIVGRVTTNSRKGKEWTVIN